MASTTCELKYSSPYIYTLLHWYNAFSLIYTYTFTVTACQATLHTLPEKLNLLWTYIQNTLRWTNIFEILQKHIQPTCVPTRVQLTYFFFFFYQGFRNMHACNSSLSFLENYAFRTFHDVPTWEISNIPIISLLSRFILLWLIF